MLIPRVKNWVVKDSESSKNGFSMLLGVYIHQGMTDNVRDDSERGAYFISLSFPCMAIDDQDNTGGERRRT